MTTDAFRKAVLRLEEAIRQPKNDFLRDSVIQRFEFSIELAWKTARRVMGTATTAPKDVVREMAQGGYIDDVAIWFLAIDMRNLSSHTYREELAEQVYAFACRFVPHLTNLLDRLERR
jgi:nucleotidyltransferase substrate binding protein (TIGR01987 family)